MALKELHGSGYIRETTQGIEGQRVFVAPFATWRLDVDRQGSQFPGYPELILHEREMVPLTPAKSGGLYYDLVKVTCTYTTASWIDNVPQWSGEIGAEVLETGYGAKWKGTGRKSQQMIPVVFPLEERTLSFVTAILPEEASIWCAGKINAFEFLGFPPETLLYNGMSWDARYDYDRQRYAFAVHLRFTFRPMSWEIAWRVPEQARIDGQLVYDENSEPVLVSGPAGKGGWDRLDPPSYQQADFNPLIGRRARNIMRPW